MTPKINRAFVRPTGRQPAKAEPYTPRALWWVNSSRAEWSLLIHARWIEEAPDGPPRNAVEDRA